MPSAATLLVIAAALWLPACSSAPRILGAGFWFDDVAFTAADGRGGPLEGGLGGEDLARIEVVARDELQRAYAGLRITFSDRPDAFYRVRVVQTLRHPYLRGVPQAGESRALGIFGGTGAVSFSTLAHNAVRYAPNGATRAEVVDAIGKGIGRAAAHEFAHQVLNADIDVRDVGTYEHYSAGRVEQYYGTLTWGRVGARLATRIGRVTTAGLAGAAAP